MKMTMKLILSLTAVMMILTMNGCDKGSSSNDVNPPIFPSWINASKGTHKERVTIKWEEISNADYYVLTKSQNGRLGAYTEIEYQIPATSFFDESVDAGKTYYYKVKAVNSAGESVYGPSAEGSTMKDTDAEPVATPSWITATNGTETNKISLVWNDVSADSYNIYRQEKDSGIYILIKEDNTTTTYEDYDIESGVHYLYKIEAVTGDSSSEFSQYAEGYAGEPSELTPAEFYEILKPIIEHVWLIIDQNEFKFPMEINGAFGGSIYATMTAVYDPPGSDNFVGSTVVLVFDNFNQDGHIANGTLTLDLDTILQGDETGTLTVTGAHEATVDFDIDIGPRPDGHSSEQGGKYIISTGGPSEEVIWRAPDITIVLYPPENVVASDGDNYGFVKVSWDASSRAVSYKVYRSEFMYGVYAPIAEDVVITSYDDYDVSMDGDTNYFYKISACYGTIESEKSSPNLGYPGTIPATLNPPSGVTATDGTNASRIDISWQAVTGGEYYRVFRSSTADGTYSTQIGSNITGTSCQDTSVSASTQYYYKVRAYNSGASIQSELSAYDSGYAGSLVGIPGTPANVSATDKAANNKERVLITWNVVATASYYRVYRSATLDGSYSLIADGVTTTSYEDRSMHLDTVYYYKVKAVNTAGESDFSAADQGSRQITIDEFYSDIFRPASKYAKKRIYDTFPEPNIGDSATWSGDNSGSMSFKVTLGGWTLLGGFWGKPTVTYTNLSDGDLNKATTGTSEGGIILNGVITGKVFDISGNGTETGTLTVTGSHSGTCEYHLEIVDRITNGGYIIVTFNGETKSITYINTDNE